jgi:epoxyqueuosine reductase QueG
MDSSPVSEIAKLITDLVVKRVACAGTVTPYRAPLVAFARADDPRFDELPRLIPGHLHPRDLLPAARSVCAFFLPFDPAVVRGNARGEQASEAWARAYVETNALLAGICAALGEELGQHGVGVAWEPPTHNFDPVRLVSAWSHKSIAAITGLGQFGHHHMLITKAGCAGRLGSVVLDLEAPRAPERECAIESETAPEPLCTYNRGCRTCIRRCPAGALTEQGLDRARCYAQCLANDARLAQWLADVCGKCATGPCAIL